ncbi:MAG: YpsA SLOG family protein [Desulfovermiculus sp.]
MVFTYGNPTGGTKLTVDLAIQHEKPFYVIDLNFEPLNRDPELVWDWGLESDVYVLNVADPRESKHPNTKLFVKAIMLELLKFAKKCYSVKS